MRRDVHLGLIGAATTLLIGLLAYAAHDVGYRYPFCRPGYAESVRPPYAVTHWWKVALVMHDSRGLPVSAYELDHIVPIELGGDPSSPSNLQLQLWPDARRKDRLENELHREVCDGSISLQQAQREMRDWK